MLAAAALVVAACSSGKGVGQTCTQDSDCASGSCVGGDACGGMHCTCTGDSDCSSGSHCVPTQSCGSSCTVPIGGG